MLKLSKISFLIGIILLVYGYLCCIFNIYFLWDSKTIGWIALFVALTGLLFELHKTRRLRGKRTIWVKIGIGILIFGLLLLPFVVFMLNTSDAYQAAIEYLNTNSQIKPEIGNVKGFGLIPTGSVHTVTINGFESGEATFPLLSEVTKNIKM